MIVQRDLAITVVSGRLKDSGYMSTGLTKFKSMFKVKSGVMLNYE